MTLTELFESVRRVEMIPTKLARVLISLLKTAEEGFRVPPRPAM